MKKIILYILAALGVIAILILIGLAFFSVKNSITGNMSGNSFSDSMVVPASAPMAQSFRSTKSLAVGESSASSVNNAGANSISSGQLAQRKVTKNGSLSLIVEKAETAAVSIQTIAENAGGFVSHSQIYEVADGIKSGSITIRLPADKFNQAMIDIKKIANKVERENVDAQDVTEQYTDLTARLRNAQATENQYLAIMKQAGKVQDLLDVQQKLGEVRGEIEQIQGQLKYLNSQVDMSTIDVSLTAQADVQVFGIQWRPLTVIKQAFRNLLSSLTGYIDAIIGLIFLLPVIVLWLATIGIILFALWKLGWWIKRKFFSKTT